MDIRSPLLAMCIKKNYEKLAWRSLALVNVTYNACEGPKLDTYMSQIC